MADVESSKSEKRSSLAFDEKMFPKRSSTIKSSEFKKKLKSHMPEYARVDVPELNIVEIEELTVSLSEKKG